MDDPTATSHQANYRNAYDQFVAQVPTADPVDPLSTRYG